MKNLLVSLLVLLLSVTGMFAADNEYTATIKISADGDLAKLHCSDVKVELNEDVDNFGKLQTFIEQNKTSNVPTNLCDLKNVLNNGQVSQMLNATLDWLHNTYPNLTQQ